MSAESWNTTRSNKGNEIETDIGDGEMPDLDALQRVEGTIEFNAGAMSMVGAASDEGGED